MRFRHGLLVSVSSDSDNGTLAGAVYAFARTPLSRDDAGTRATSSDASVAVDSGAAGQQAPSFPAYDSGLHADAGDAGELDAASERDAGHGNTSRPDTGCAYRAGERRAAGREVDACMAAVLLIAALRLRRRRRSAAILRITAGRAKRACAYSTTSLS